jgi:hypothetical protein
MTPMDDSVCKFGGQDGSGRKPGGHPMLLEEATVRNVARSMDEINGFEL